MKTKLAPSKHELGRIHLFCTKGSSDKEYIIILAENAKTKGYTVSCFFGPRCRAVRPGADGGKFKTIAEAKASMRMIADSKIAKGYTLAEDGETEVTSFSWEDCETTTEEAREEAEKRATGAEEYDDDDDHDEEEEEEEPEAPAPPERKPDEIMSDVSDELAELISSL